MVYKINIDGNVFKFLNKILEKDRVRILAKIKELENPLVHMFLDIKKMRGFENVFRLRVGVYRVVYEKYDNLLIIEVIEIDHRKDIYK